MIWKWRFYNSGGLKNGAMKWIQLFQILLLDSLSAHRVGLDKLYHEVKTEAFSHDRNHVKCKEKRKKKVKKKERERKDGTDNQWVLKDRER